MANIKVNCSKSQIGQKKWVIGKVKDPMNKYGYLPVGEVGG